MNGITCLKFPTLIPTRNHFANQNLNFSKTSNLKPVKSTQQHHILDEDDEGIPIDMVKTLVKFKSRYNYIRVVEVSRKANHPLSGSRLLLLDTPGNIHSISFLFKTLTNAYFDVFATLPPVLPHGPLGILGFGAGSAAKIILETYQEIVIQSWELDPAVIEVGRKYFGVSHLEKKYPERLFIYIGNAISASNKNGVFSGILVDLFCKGVVIPELQNPTTWENLKKSLMKGGRIMVNVGGSCVEPEDIRKDGKMIMEETLQAMQKVFDKEIYVLCLENRKDESMIAMAGGEFPDRDKWKKALPKPLRYYVDVWKPYTPL
ncbi:methyltransferase [Lithospermum erythrorhizon]|uniref:Methyltransferase n=1 Tax=Lithospermum erythrorhizon TaxID=34254 RepID=A0AAV3PDM3_LITER